MSLRESIRRLLIRGISAARLDAIERLRRQPGRSRRHAVRVFYLHGTPASHADRFRQQLSLLRERFTLIDFDTFKRLYDGSTRVGTTRPAALLTFDDGFASNHEIAARMLEDAGTRGVFFIVASFSAATDDDARRLYRDRIHGRHLFEAPMTPDQVRDLVRRGHTIGNHTLSHACLSQVPETDYQHEIVKSAAILESWIQRPVEAFAWPFVWNAITRPAHRLICERHAYCFTPCSGLTDARVDSRRLIWRTSIEPHYDDAEFRFQVSGLADYISASRRWKLARMLLSS